jgi:hypothetical protein
MVEHAGESLDKDTLLQAIWRGVIVEENSLTQNISTLRHVLGEARDEIAISPRYAAGAIDLSRRSPRCDEPAMPAPARSPSLHRAGLRRAQRSGSRGRWALTVAIAVVALVLHADRIPAARFRRPPDLGHSSVQAAAAGGAQRIPGVGHGGILISSPGPAQSQAISPLSSVRRFAALDRMRLRQVAIWASTRCSTVHCNAVGDRLRGIGATVARCRWRQLWAQSFDQAFTTIFEVQDVIAARVAQSLSVRWTGGESVRGAPYTAGFGSVRALRERALGLDKTDGGESAARDRVLRTGHRTGSRLRARLFGSRRQLRMSLACSAYRAPRATYSRVRVAPRTKRCRSTRDLAAAHSALGHIELMYEHDVDAAAREYARAPAARFLAGIDVSPARTDVRDAG